MRKLNFWVPLREKKWHTPICPSIHSPPRPSPQDQYSTLVKKILANFSRVWRRACAVRSKSLVNISVCNVYLKSIKCLSVAWSIAAALVIECKYFETDIRLFSLCITWGEEDFVFFLPIILISLLAAREKLPIPLEVGSNFDIPPVAHNRAEGTIRNDQRSLLHTAGGVGCCNPPAGSLLHTAGGVGCCNPPSRSRGQSPWKLQKHCSLQYLKIGKNACSWLTFYCILQTQSEEKILICLDLLREKIGESPIKTHEFHHFFEKYGL